MPVWPRRLMPLVLVLGLTHCGAPEQPSSTLAPGTEAASAPDGDTSEQALALSEGAAMRGSCARARLVEDINEGLAPSHIANLTDVNGTLFFTADDGEHGVELWKSDGTRGGTRLVKDITPGAAGSDIRELTEVKGKVFFAVGTELWKSDGTERGTVRLATFADAGFRPSPRSLFEYRGKLVFEGFDAEHGRELWVSDGTARGTKLLLDYNPGPRSSSPGDFAELDGDLVFTVFDLTRETLLLVKLEDWKCLTELGNLGDESSVQQMLVVGHRVFIFYFDEGDPTVGVATGKPGSLKRRLFITRSEDVFGLVELEGKVYFQASSQLWVTDGTEVGTRLVKDILPGSGREKPILFLTAFSHRLYFSADDGVSGRELWVSDGSEGGTRLFADINPGPASSSPTDLLNVHNSKLYFAADDGVHGREPWKLHRGDEPELLMDLAPGAASSSPRGFIRSDGDIFFAADDGRVGEELWATPKEQGNCHQ